MNDVHSHTLTLKRRLRYYGLGVFFAIFGLAFITASVFSEDPFSSFVPSLCPLVSFLTVGIFFIAASFATKVTTSKDGIEYHTPLLTVSAPWQHLQVYERQELGKFSLVIVPTEGKVILRPLTKMFSWLVRKDARSFSIDTSHFSSDDGHLLESEVNAFRVHEEES